MEGEQLSINNYQLLIKKYAEYKDSGVAWLGEIPKRWVLKRLKFLSSIKTGERNTEDKIAEGLYPFFVRSQIPERINSYCFDGEAILTAGDGAGVGKVYHYINGKFDYHQRVYKFSHFNDITGRLLFYFLQSNFYNVAMLGTAKSTVDSLRLPLIQNFEVCFPTDKEEQRAIAEFLDEKTGKIDTAVAQKERLIALLQERKQIIIQAMVSGQWIIVDGKDGQPRIAKQNDRGQFILDGAPLPIKTKPSGVEWLGDIPEHWEVKRLKYISPNQSVGLVITPSYYVDEKGTIPFLFGGDISEGHISIEKARRITEESNQILSKSRLKSGDLVTVRVGYPGITAVVPPELDNCNCASMMIIRQSSKFYSPWLCYVMNSKVGKTQIEIVQYGAAQKQFNISHAVEFTYPFPPLSEQRTIVAHIETQTAKIERAIALLQEQIAKLKEYKTILINSAVTGKIRVPRA